MFDALAVSLATTMFTSFYFTRCSGNRLHQASIGTDGTHDSLQSRDDTASPQTRIKRLTNYREVCSVGRSLWVAFGANAPCDWEYAQLFNRPLTMLIAFS